MTEPTEDFLRSAPPFIVALADQVTSLGNTVFAEVLGPYLGFCAADSLNQIEVRSEHHLLTTQALAEHKSNLALGLMYALNVLIEEWVERYGSVSNIIEAISNDTFHLFHREDGPGLPPDPFK